MFELVKMADLRSATSEEYSVALAVHSMGYIEEMYQFSLLLRMIVSCILIPEGLGLAN